MGNGKISYINFRAYFASKEIRYQDELETSVHLHGSLAGWCYRKCSD